MNCFQVRYFERVELFLLQIYEDMHVTPRKLIDGIGNEISSGTLNTVVYVDTVNDW